MKTYVKDFIRSKLNNLLKRFVEPEVIIQREVIQTGIPLEFIDRLDRQFPIKTFDSGDDYLELARNAGEQRVLRYLRRVYSGGVSL